MHDTGPGDTDTIIATNVMIDTGSNFGADAQHQFLCLRNIGVCAMIVMVTGWSL